MRMFRNRKIQNWESIIIVLPSRISHSWSPSPARIPNRRSPHPHTAISDISTKMATPALSSALTSPTDQLVLEILLTTTSGRYIFHHPTSETNFAPTSFVTTLAAALTAFIHTTHSTVRTIHTSQQVLHMISSPPLLLAISTPTNTPTPSLTPFARLLFATVYAAASRSLHGHLLNNPTASTGKIAALVGPLLQRVVTSFSRHPLPVHLSLSPALPSPINVRQRTLLQSTMRNIIRPKPELTHALLTVKSSDGTGIEEVLVAVFREGMRLSWLDHVLLSCADEDRLFLPTTGFRRGLHVRRRSLKSVSAMRVEVCPAMSRVYNLLVLGTWSSNDATPADGVLDDLQDILSASGTMSGMHGALHGTNPIIDDVHHAAAPIYISLNSPPENDSVEALLMLGSSCCIGTNRAYDPLIATPIAKAISLARTRGERIAYVSSGVCVLVEDVRYVVVFKESVPREKAQTSALKVVMWMKRFEQSLLPPDSGVCIPYDTPLAGFLAPFRS